MCIYIYIYMCVYIYIFTCLYIYIYRERERKQKGDKEIDREPVFNAELGLAVERQRARETPKARCIL